MVSIFSIEYESFKNWTICPIGGTQIGTTVTLSQLRLFENYVSFIGGLVSVTPNSEIWWQGLVTNPNDNSLCSLGSLLW